MSDSLPRRSRARSGLRRGGARASALPQLHDLGLRRAARWGTALALLLLGPGLAVPAHADPLPGAPAVDAALAARLRAVARPAELQGTGRSAAPAPRFTNRLALEASPYLQEHAHNPVNWYPWGDEALAAAHKLGRPIFLSIGYSTCHWCHVMERESFEDLEIAEFLNRHFIPVKVDREERPDLDASYLAAIPLWTGGSGGWPMTVFLGADGKPFFGGTYFPPRDVPGSARPGLLRVLREVHELYTSNPQRVATAQEAVGRALRERLEVAPRSDALDARPLLAAAAEVERSFDAAHGGLAGPAKFPSALPVALLLRVQRRTGRAPLLQMVEQTLDAMRRGGIHDAVGGGFHRYTVDDTWTVPHFEKMLADNAALASMYLEAWQVTQRPQDAAVARDVFEYVAREMTDPGGAFYTASDADSDGQEGRYYTWSRAELESAVGKERAQLAVRAYGLDARPNFGELYVLRRDRSSEELAQALGRPAAQIETELQEIRARLRAAREKRTAPLRDDKQLVGWNGAMISALAHGALLLGDAELGERAARAADALLAHGFSPEQGLARYLRGGQRYGAAVLEDYAYLIAGLLDLFELRAEPRWLDSALLLQKGLDERFWDDAAGGYWQTSTPAAPGLPRSKPVIDESLPSANGVAARNLLRLYSLVQDGRLRIRAEMTLRGLSAAIEPSPASAAGLLEALDWMLDSPREIAIAGVESSAQAEPFLQALARCYLPNRVLVIGSDAQLGALAARIPWLEGKHALGGVPTAFLCTNQVCLQPTSDPAELAAQLQASAPAPLAAPAPFRD